MLVLDQQSTTAPICTLQCWCWHRMHYAPWRLKSSFSNSLRKVVIQALWRLMWISLMRSAPVWRPWLIALTLDTFSSVTLLSGLVANAHAVVKFYASYLLHSRQPEYRIKHCRLLTEDSMCIITATFKQKKESPYLNTPLWKMQNCKKICPRNYSNYNKSFQQLQRFLAGNSHELTFVL